MAEYNFDEIKTSIMGGYDKEDVQDKINILIDEYTKKLEEKDKEINDYKEGIEKRETLIAEKNREIDTLKADIKDKYQSYIDNYNTIGKIVYESRIKSEKIIDDANSNSAKILDDANSNSTKILEEATQKSRQIVDNAKQRSEKIISEANKKAQSQIDKTQGEVDRIISDGKKRYESLQEETNELIQLVNQVQHKFMQSFKAIHEISGNLNDDEDETGFDIEFDED